MGSLYTKEVRQFVNSRPWPNSLEWRVVELEDQLKFKMYRDNINALTDSDKLALAPLINETLSKISKSGIPIFTWIEKGDGLDDRGL